MNTAVRVHGSRGYSIYGFSCRREQPDLAHGSKSSRVPLFAYRYVIYALARDAIELERKTTLVHSIFGSTFAKLIPAARFYSVLTDGGASRRVPRCRSSAHRGGPTPVRGAAAYPKAQSQQRPRSHGELNPPRSGRAQISL